MTGPVPTDRTGSLANGQGQPAYAVVLPALDIIARRWCEIEPLLKKATDRTAGYEPIDLFRLVMLGQRILWLVEHGSEIAAVAVGELKPYPRCRVLEVPFIAGRGLKAWHQQLLDALDAYARATGCSALMGFDRRGWEHYGFREIGVVLERRLEPLQ